MQSVETFDGGRSATITYQEVTPLDKACRDVGEACDQFLRSQGKPFSPTISAFKGAAGLPFDNVNSIHAYSLNCGAALKGYIHVNTREDIGVGEPNCRLMVSPATDLGQGQHSSYLVQINDGAPDRHTADLDYGVLLEQFLPTIAQQD